MHVNILCLGDIVGRPGRLALAQILPGLVRDEGIDCVIANAENVASGAGMTKVLYEKLCKVGVNVFTMGDHIYRRPDIVAVLEQSSCIGRPANLQAGAVGKDIVIYETASNVRIAVISVLGRLYMKPMGDCPYAAIDRVLAQVPRDVSVIVVDFHAEATSEKIAMGWYVDGRVSLLVGTHTHVPTADETILPNGTGYITDLGMTGPYDSVLGRRKDRVIRAMVTGMPTRFDVAIGDPRVCGVLATIDANTRRTVAIRRVMIRADLPELTEDDGYDHWGHTGQ